MKKYFFGVIISLSLSISATATATASELRAIDYEICDVNSKLAQAVMKHRQDGLPMKNLMQVLDNSSTRDLIILAYSKPRMSSIEGKKRYIQDFENDVYLECIKERKIKRMEK